MTNKITISKGNSKMGAIPSISLPACTTCNPDAPCFKKCYALKISRLYTNVRKSYENNLEVLNTNWREYWQQVKKAAAMSKYFRYHVSGDIPDINYLYNMVDLARDLPGTHFLAFTKQYHIVNDYVQYDGTIPDNLTIIFSNWGAWQCENPHNLPTCEIIFKGEEPDPHWQICGGNCTECACNGTGCWTLKKGESIAIYEH